MLNNFLPEYFFDYKKEDFAAIFEFKKPLWQAFRKIPNFLQNKIYIHPSVIIEPYVHIIGPAFIGKNTILRSGAYIRENVIIGKNCVIGHATELKNSIILSHSSAAHFNYIGDSIIGQNVNIAGGASFANLRLDRKKVTVKYKNKKISTNLEKFGAIIGDNTQIGAQVVLNPGTIIGKNCIIYPQAFVNGFYKEGSIIK